MGRVCASVSVKVRMGSRLSWSVSHPELEAPGERTRLRSQAMIGPGGEVTGHESVELEE